jgi:cytochrome c-type biogenesis protein CcmH/NrfG
LRPLEALRRDRSHVNSWVALGSVDAAMKDYAGCAEASQRALSLDPGNEMAAQNLELAETELKQAARP